MARGYPMASQKKFLDVANKEAWKISAAAWSGCVDTHSGPLSNTSARDFPAFFNWSKILGIFLADMIRALSRWRSQASTQGGSNCICTGEKSPGLSRRPMSDHSVRCQRSERAYCTGLRNLRIRSSTRSARGRNPFQQGPTPDCIEKRGNFIAVWDWPRARRDSLSDQSAPGFLSSRRSARE